MNHQPILDLAMLFTEKEDLLARLKEIDREIEKKSVEVYELLGETNDRR